jgi:hypothetical protein
MLILIGQPGLPEMRGNTRFDGVQLRAARQDAVSAIATITVFRA